jgi:ubiquitin carboxyl-terminal hydrolase 25
VLPIGRKGFQKKMGWNTNVSVILTRTFASHFQLLTYSQRIFEALGFTLDEVAASPKGDAGPALFPPNTSSATPESSQNRAKLLRAWVEISAWLADYRRRQCEDSLVLDNLLDADMLQPLR